MKKKRPHCVCKAKCQRSCECKTAGYICDESCLCTDKCINLGQILHKNDLESFYTKEELKDFARKSGVILGGNKSEIAERLEGRIFLNDSRIIIKGDNSNLFQGEYSNTGKTLESKELLTFQNRETFIPSDLFSIKTGFKESKPKKKESKERRSRQPERNSQEILQDYEIEALVNQMKDMTFEDVYNIKPIRDSKPETRENPKPYIKESIKNSVWEKYCDPKSYEGKCFCCLKSIKRSVKGWECGHITPRSKGGEAILNNLRPLCPSCNSNSGIGGMHMYEYMFYHKMDGLINLTQGDLDADTKKEIRKYEEWVRRIYKLAGILHQKLFENEISHKEVEGFEKYIAHSTRSLEERERLINEICRRHKINLNT